MTVNAAIFGCEGLTLSDWEAGFFREADPYGFILFARNCADPAQVSALVAGLRGCVGRADAPVLIDQEGGRVARLRPPHWRAAPPAGAFGALARRDPERARDAVRLNARLLAAELVRLGITVDCLPVLDLPTPGGHEVIGDRAFGGDPDVVALLGRACCEGLLEGGVLPVIKHIPGHGRATVDSHHRLPVVDAPRAALEAHDFRPFAALADQPWAMTAHVVYSAIDGERPATLSPTVIAEVIRGHMGFDGMLVSDDISMQALSGDIGARAAAALEAGCDVVLHCNGKRAEMRAVAEAVAPMSAAAQRRAARAQARLSPAAGGDMADMTARLDALLGAA